MTKAVVVFAVIVILIAFAEAGNTPVFVHAGSNGYIYIEDSCGKGLVLSRTTVNFVFRDRQLVIIRVYKNHSDFEFNMLSEENATIAMIQFAKVM